MGPPVLPAPSVSPMRRVAHPQPPPVLDTHSYFGGPHPQDNWGMVTPPNANTQPPFAHVGPSPAFISPTRGAAHRLPPPTEDPMPIYSPVMGAPGHSSAPLHNYALPDHPTYMGPRTNWGTVHPSHPLPEYSMAIDHPSVVNNGGYYSSVPTPHSHLTTITPPRVNPRQAIHPSPQAHSETLVTPPPRQISSPSARTPVRTAAERNTSSARQYLGDIPANQLPRQRSMASGTRAEGFMGNSRTRGGPPIVPSSVASSSTPLSGISVNTQPVSPAHLCG